MSHLLRLSKYHIANALVPKGDKLNLQYCPLNLKTIQLGSIMYAQVCICHDIAYKVHVLGRYSSNPLQNH